MGKRAEHRGLEIVYADVLNNRSLSHQQTYLLRQRMTFCHRRPSTSCHCVCCCGFRVLQSWRKFVKAHADRVDLTKRLLVSVATAVHATHPYLVRTAVSAVWRRVTSSVCLPAESAHRRCCSWGVSSARTPGRPLLAVDHQIWLTPLPPSTLLFRARANTLRTAAKLHRSQGPCVLWDSFGKCG